MREKRKFTRITLNVPTMLSFLQVESYHIGFISNISMGGCYFPTSEIIPVGAECLITITVGEGIETEDISIPGEIVRCDGKGIGIRFSYTLDSLGQQLRKIINRSSPDKLNTSLCGKSDSRSIISTQ